MSRPILASGIVLAAVVAGALSWRHAPPPVVDNRDAGVGGDALAMEATDTGAAGQEAPATEPLVSAGPAIRVEELEVVDLPPGPLVDAYGALAERALMGDERAAYQLYLGLRRCRYAPRTRNELEAAVRGLYKDGVIDPVVGERELEQDLAYCEGIAMRADEFHAWLKHAAELGYLPAVKLMGFELPPSWIANEDHTLIAGHLAELADWQRRAVDAGIVDAMMMLAISYDRGRGVTQDAFEAYVYATAVVLALEAAGKGHPEIRDLAVTMSAGLSPWQLEEARRRAVEIVTSPACCKF